ncbi:MAG TPA: acyl-CoA dehydrogenase [Streptosporangiaceae bacterium]|jgi:alkylation response protein AidB-like acyl-CoA dehydrogenase
MSLAPTEEQTALVQALRDFLDTEADGARVRTIMESPDALDLELWRRMTSELGIGGALIPEEHGGAGLGVPELALIMECAGRHPMGLPLLSHMLAVTALTTVADPGPAAPYLRTLASETAPLATVIPPAAASGPGEPVRARRSGAEWHLTGDAEFVLDGHAAGLLLAVADTSDGEALFAVDGAASGVARERLDMLDLTRPMARVAFDAAPAVALCAPGAEPRIARLLDIAAVALAAEQVGGADRCLELSVAHARTREQFGRPIGSFQAIKHMCADLLRAIEPARSAVHMAAHAAAADPAALPPLASLVKAHCPGVYAEAAYATVQIHGGLGYSWEHDAHLHVKRAKTGEALFGDPARHRDRLMLTRGAGHDASESPDAAEDADIRALRTEVRDWLAAHQDQAVRANGAHPPHHHRTSDEERRWVGLLREGGWLCLSWPRAYGGRGLGELACLAVIEEFARAGVQRPHLGMGETLVAPAILGHGTEEQKRRLLPRILSGEDVYCQGFSEPGSGSDLASLRTKGVVDGDELVVDGHKIWTSGGAQATMMFLLCRTDPDAERHRGLTYALVPMAGNGIDVRPIRQMAGGAGFCEEYIDGARTPLDNVIGGLGNGWRVAMTTLGAERAGEVTTQYFGYRQEYDHLASRLNGLGRLADPLVRDELASLLVRVELMRCHGRRVADKLRAGQDVRTLLAIDKLNWSEFHCDFGAAALSLQGLPGLLRPTADEYQVDDFQRTFLESRGRRIARGTNQIQRNIIAERALSLPK